VTNNSYGQYIYTYSLPFPFRFINVNYNQGTTIRVSTNGYVSFSTSTLGSTSIASGDGGVYYKVEGSVGDRVLTIEWRGNEGYNYYSDGSIGNFQIRLYERTSNIEWHYGPNSLNIGYYFYSALVGIKDLGEYYYYSGTQPTNSTRNTPEAQRYYLFNNPSYSRDTVPVAVTGMRIQWWGTYGYLEYYPYFYIYTGTAYRQDTNQSFVGWHSTFPTDRETHERIAYRMSPVLNDVASDSLWFSPSVTADAYSPGASVTPSARFRNLGGNSRQNVPVQADVYYNGTQFLGSVTATAFPNSTAQFGTNNVTFPAFSSTLLNQTGVYEVRVYPKLSIDQVPSNDTFKYLFLISKELYILTY
jgi:hypothetical protein